MYAIEAKGLTKRFGQLIAVDNLSFRVKEGEIFGLLGPNGAGKTTTINMLTGLLLPDKGGATVLGYDIRKEIEKIRKHISLVPQTVSLYTDLTLYENLEFFGSIFIKNKRDLEAKIEDVIKLFGLGDHVNKLVQNLSGGFQRRTSVAVGLLNDPQVLFLDEPTSGIDIVTNKVIMQFMRKKKGEMTIVLTTHSIKEAEAVCDNLIFISRGKKILAGSPYNLTERFAERVGERVIVHLKGSARPAELRKELTEYEFVRDIKCKRGFLIFTVTKIGEKIIDILSILEKYKHEIKDIDIKKPDLEDMFTRMMRNE
jgi:ABC-2 type transport system ATP-binding protein